MSGNDDFQIELGQSTRRHIEQKKSPLEDANLCALPYDDPQGDQIPVFVSESVMRSIERHVLSDKQHEVGGVLLGEFYRNDDGSFVEVTDFIEAADARGTDVSLTFTHDTWEQITSEQSKRGGSTRIVGWYHSHPGLGVFMSREDEFIHSSYFTDPWHVALVVDPIYHNWGCFKWRDGSLERTSGFYVFGEKKAAKRVREYAKALNDTRQSAPRHASASAQRMQAPQSPPIGLWVAVTLLLALLLVVGWKTFLDKPDHYAIAMQHLRSGDLTGGARYLAQAPKTEESLRAAGEVVAALSEAKDSRSQADMDSISYLVARFAPPFEGGSATYALDMLERAESTYNGRRDAADALTSRWGRDAQRSLRNERLWLLAYVEEKGGSAKRKRYQKELDEVSRDKTFRAYCRRITDTYSDSGAHREGK